MDFFKGPAIRYREFLPYMDKLWLGESLVYDKVSCGNWQVEASGIAFGLTDGMLHLLKFKR